MSVEFEITNFSFVAVLGMALAFASFAIMLIIAGRQTKQTDNLAVVTKDIEKMVSDQTKLTNDLRDVYASSIVEYIQRISVSYGHAIDLYLNKYPNGKITLNKDKIRNTLDSYYDRHLFHLPRIEPIELVKAFGKEIADKHWRLTPKLMSNMWQTHSDYGMALLMHSYKDQMNKLVELKDAFLHYCNQATKDKDKKYQENYDLIKKEWNDVKTPKREDFTDEFSNVD